MKNVVVCCSNLFLYKLLKYLSLTNHMNIIKSFTDKFDESDIKIINLVMLSHIKKIMKKISKKYTIDYNELYAIGEEDIGKYEIILDKNKKQKSKKTNNENIKKKRGRPRKYVEKEVIINGELEEESNNDIDDLLEIDKKLYIENQQLIRKTMAEIFQEGVSNDYSDSDTDTEYEEIHCKVIEWNGVSYLKDINENIYERYYPYDVVGKWVNNSLHISTLCENFNNI